MDTAWLLIVLLLIACAYLLMRYRVASQETLSLRNVARQTREQAGRLARQVTDEQQIRQALAETMIDPVFYVDADRTILFCNAAAQHLTRGAAQPGRSLMETARSYELDNFAEETLSAQNELPREVTINERLFRARATVFSIGPASQAQSSSCATSVNCSVWAARGATLWPISHTTCARP